MTEGEHRSGTNGVDLEFIRNSGLRSSGLDKLARSATDRLVRSEGVRVFLEESAS